MIRNISSGILVSIMLILAGCKQDTDNTKLAPFIYDYVPHDVGHSVTYDVDSISYSYDANTGGGVQVYDTIHYQLKDVILDSANSVCQLGTVCYSVAEYKRYDTTQPFPANYQASYIYFSNTTYFADIMDITFEKFVFPPIVGINWQGNAFIPTADTLNISDPYWIYSQPSPWTYTFTSVNSPAIINGHRLDSTAVVTAMNSESTNAVEGVVSMETYARHIGLVYREFEYLNKQDPTSTYALPNQTNGFRVLQWLHSYTP